MAYDPKVVQAIVQQARLAGVNPALMAAVAMEESGLNPRAVGDQRLGGSYGLFQLHTGGALGRLSPQQAFDPSVNAGVIARSIAAAGGQKWGPDAAGLTNYYRAIGRGSSVSGPTNRALSMLPQVQSLLGQPSAQVPAVGTQSQQQVTAAGTPSYSRGLSPALLASLTKYGEQSIAAGLAGNRDFALPTKLLAQLAQVQQQNSLATPMVANAPTTGTSRFTGAIPGPIQGLDYPLGAKGPLIGEPYQGTHTLGNWESDRAVDIKVPVGTPVIAPEDGVIGSQIGALGSSSPRMAGLRVHLDGPADNFYFAHLSRLAVQPGQHVKAGQVIGYSGSASGVAHLHFASQKRDPRQYVGG